MIESKSGFPFTELLYLHRTKQLQRSWRPSVSGGQNACYEIHIDEDLEELQTAGTTFLGEEHEIQTQHCLNSRYDIDGLLDKHKSMEYKMLFSVRLK